MHRTGVTFMQDQVHNRVTAIMAADPRHPDRRPRPLAQALLALAVTGLYLVVHAVGSVTLRVSQMGQDKAHFAGNGAPFPRSATLD